MTPEEMKRLGDTLAKISEVIVSLNKRVTALESRNKELEEEFMRIQVKELSREMKGTEHENIRNWRSYGYY